jgi:Zn-dependent alcohol dehydrogenase
MVGMLGMDKELFIFTAAKFGATDFINPEKLPEGKSLVEYIREKYDGGLDFAFEATGNITAMVKFQINIKITKCQFLAEPSS